MDTALSRPVGQLLSGRYHVGSRIARGGMATVYLGTDTRLDRVVAIKIAHPELSDDAGFVRRFIGEARSAARLTSPNVVAIYDQASDGRLHYIAMEYVPGRTLRQVLNERGRLGARESLDVMSGVLAGLAVAHEAGLAHRDVKPENVLMTASGQVKISDFGLARSVAGNVQTRGGMIIGTAAYLAPEQVTGGISDARTDVYAAGVMLFELLTGRQPHTGESPLAVAYKHVNEAVPAPSSVLPGLSPSLDALVAMATSRDPDLRPADAGQFLRAISQVRNGVALPTTPPGTAPHVAPDRPRGDGRSGPRTAPYHGRSGPLEMPDRGSHPYAAEGPHPYPAEGQHPYPAEGSHPYPPEGVSERNAPNWSEDPTWEQPGAIGASALPSLSPQAPPLTHGQLASLGDAGSGDHHTLIVPAEGTLTGYRDEAHWRGGEPYPASQYRRRMRGRGSGNWLSDLLFGRRFWYLAGVLAVALVIGLVTWWLSAGRYTKIPPLRGVVSSTAQGELRNLGLRARLGSSVHNDLPAGVVVKTSPPIGSRVTGGSVVTLILSLGPVRIQVPNVSGQPLASAEAALKQAKLTVGAVTNVTSSTVPPGNVITTTPPAYTSWPQDKPVGITVSAGPGLPNFVGMQVSAAQAAAASGGYTINPVADANGTQPANTITSQSPAANTPITHGEVVTVHYSPGPPMVAVPNVKGMSVQEATLLLHRAGFQVSVSQGLGNRVVNYSPTGSQPKGTTITIYVGLFSGGP